MTERFIINRPGHDDERKVDLNPHLKQTSLEPGPRHSSLEIVARVRMAPVQSMKVRIGSVTNPEVSVDDPAMRQRSVSKREPFCREFGFAAIPLFHLHASD